MPSHKSVMHHRRKAEADRSGPKPRKATRQPDGTWSKPHKTSKPKLHRTVADRAAATERGVTEHQDSKGRFTAGNRAALGRANHNYLARDIKEGIIDAAVACGYDGKGKDGLVGYLTMLASHYPKAYTTLLARVIPLQVQGTGVGFIGAVNVIPVPVDRYLTADDIQAMQPVEAEPLIIDHPPQVVAEPLEPDEDEPQEDVA